MHVSNPVPFLDFYDKIGFAPTRQKGSPSAAHQAHREFLYRSLGVPNLAFRGRDVIEFGAGSGENTDRLLGLGPSSYTFVDGAEAVLSGLMARNSSSFAQDTSLHFALSTISDYEDDRRYDFVVCEGVLPLQYEPGEMARKALGFAKVGGIAVLTCFDSVSGFSEIARRFIARSIFGELVYSAELVDRLSAFFAPDFAALAGMSRRPEDWVADSILNPWVGDFFSLQDALEVAKPDFGLLGTSPRIVQDWRWYKDPTVLDEIGTLDAAIGTYQQNLHSLLDSRFLCTEILPRANDALIETTNAIAVRVRDLISGGIPYEVEEFGADVQRLIAHTQSTHPQTIVSLSALARWSLTGLSQDLEPFRALWGRGQQYVSLVRLA